jgi:fructose-specific component phosphotransferase system IIB-like protein
LPKYLEQLIYHTLNFKKMAFSDLFSGAKDMLDKAKHLVEETTGIDVDNAIAHPEDLMNKAKDAFAHPENLMEQAKAKGAELFSQFTGGTAGETAVDPTAKTADTETADAEESDDETDEKAITATAKADDEEESDDEEETEETTDKKA